MNVNELYSLARQGGKAEEEKLFKKLYASFLCLVEYRIWNRLDAEEIVQEILMVITNKFRQLGPEINFAGWAHRVMDNKLLHYYRNQHRLKKKMIAPGDYEDPEHEDSDPELTRKLRECLEKINKANNRYARILNLSYLGFSSAEICQKIGVTRNNAFSLLFRARSMLKHCLEFGDIR